MPVQIRNDAGEITVLSREDVVDSLAAAEVPREEAARTVDVFLSRLEDNSEHVSIEDAIATAAALSKETIVAHKLGEVLSASGEEERSGEPGERAEASVGDASRPAGPATAPAMVLLEIFGALPDRRLRHACRSIIYAAEALTHRAVRRLLPDLVPLIGAAARSTALGSELPAAFEQALQRRAAAALGEDTSEMALWRMNRAVALLNESDGGASLDKLTEENILRRYATQRFTKKQLKAFPDAKIYPPNTDENRGPEAYYDVWVKAVSLERSVNLGQQTSLAAPRKPLWCQTAKESTALNKAFPTDLGDELIGYEKKIGRAGLDESLKTPTNGAYSKNFVQGLWKVDLDKSLNPGDYIVMESGLSTTVYGWTLREDSSSDLGFSGLFERLKKLTGSDSEDIKSAIKKEVTSSLSLSAGGQIVKGITKSVTDRVVDWLVEQALQELSPEEYFPLLSLYHVSYLTTGKKPITWIFASESSVASGKPRTRIVELSKVAEDKSSGKPTLDKNYTQAHLLKTRTWLGAANRRRVRSKMDALIKLTTGTPLCVVWASAQRDGLHGLIRQVLEKGVYVVAVRAETYRFTPEQARALKIPYSAMQTTP